MKNEYLCIKPMVIGPKGRQYSVWYGYNVIASCISKDDAKKILSLAKRTPYTFGEKVYLNVYEGSFSGIIDDIIVIFSTGVHYLQFSVKLDNPHVIDGKMKNKYTAYDFQLSTQLNLFA